MASGKRLTSLISSTCLAISPNILVKSTSWKASRPRISRATCPTSIITGVESCWAIWIPAEALVAPGPLVTRTIPGRPVNFPSASAMIAAPPSWRAKTVSIEDVCNASKTGKKLSPGTQNRRSTPCNSMLFTMISPPFIRLSFLK